MERCSQLQRERTIVAGGPESGSVALTLLVDARSVKELDELVTSLPVWPRMETAVTPLTTFEDRRNSVEALLQTLRS